jgi:hypothetical protein
MRMLVVAAGVLLVAALAVFLAVGKWKNPFNRRDLPQRLGITIQQEANGVDYTQASGGRTLFKIHASKVVQLKQGNAVLHDVKIELYGEDGRGTGGRPEAERRSSSLGGRSRRARRDSGEDQRAHLRPAQRSGHHQPAC